MNFRSWLLSDTHYTQSPLRLLHFQRLFTSLLQQMLLQQFVQLFTSLHFRRFLQRFLHRFVVSCFFTFVRGVMSDVGVESLDLESLESLCIRRGRWQIWRVNKEEEEEEEGLERVCLPSLVWRWCQRVAWSESVTGIRKPRIDGKSQEMPLSRSALGAV